MGNSKQEKKKVQTLQKSKPKILAVVGMIAVLILGFVVFKLSAGEASNTGIASGDLKILKSEVSETAKFYLYKAGKTKMEVMAIKASDGTIRTALNTCQICYDSGRGYYVQQGDELICQNCGNRFQPDQVELVKGGCNPVPIMSANKTDDGTNIIIPESFMEENKDLFGNWRK